MTTTVPSAFDRHMMAIALTMARRGLGRTAPNPSVGAVIADETTGEILARAVTAPGGRPHAETIAIAEAGSRATGKTIYVTLEPCAHHGQTGPCADAIVNAGLARVVTGIEDPDPRVGGRGHERLRAAGIVVDRGLMASDARWVTRGHIVRVTERRPFITLKMAMAHTGVVPRGERGQPAWVTGEAARAHGQLLRATSDAILVGSGTVRDDDPQLTCRLDGLADRSPVRVILARQLDVAMTSKLVTTARSVPVWIFCGAPSNRVRRQALSEAGCEIIPVAEVGQGLWLPAVMEALVARGITRLLVEGGERIWTAFSEAALVDEVALYMGSGSRPASVSDATRGLSAYTRTVPLIEVERREFGPDRFWRLRVAHGQEGR